jgi:hypothetical protein
LHKPPRLPACLPARLLCPLAPARLQLRGVLTAVQPQELVFPRGEVSRESRKVARAILRAPRINELPLGSGDGQVGRAGGRAAGAGPGRLAHGLAG